MKKLFILLLFPTACLGQFKTVPDSLRCITPAQVTEHIEQAFTIQHLKQSIKSKDASIGRLVDETDLLRSTIKSKDVLINLGALKQSNCENDVIRLTADVKAANKKLLAKKVLLYIIGVIAVAEMGYIGVSKLTN